MTLPLLILQLLLQFPTTVVCGCDCDPFWLDLFGICVPPGGSGGGGGGGW